MSEIRPFRGLLYNREKIGGDYSNVVAPPYDVIPPQMQDDLYKKSDYNVIRLILGKSLKDDDRHRNVYTRAKDALRNWEKEGILVKDDKESFYIYLQEYECGGKRYSRVGFIGLMKIGESGRDTVLPHEYTLAEPKADRMNLIKEVKSNLSPIFTLYDDAKGIIREVLKKGMTASEPVIDIKTDGECHKFWRLQDNDTINVIISEMKEKNVFIADGHHRYEVAKAYRDMQRQDARYNGNADYVMMYFTDLSQSNSLTVLATHRVIKTMPEAEKSEMVSKLNKYFEVTECNDLLELDLRLNQEPFGEHAFGFFDGEKYFFLKPRDKKKLLNLISEKRAVAWKSLDVSVLHSAVFNKILSINNAEGNITYVRDSENAEAIVKDGSHAAAFFLNPTGVEQLKAVAELGEMMPQKSTYFYPKLLTGLVMNEFEK